MDSIRIKGTYPVPLTPCTLHFNFLIFFTSVKMFLKGSTKYFFKYPKKIKARNLLSLGKDDVLKVFFPGLRKERFFFWLKLFSGQFKRFFLGSTENV